MDEKDLARQIIDRANALAPNSNFQISGFDGVKYGNIVQATIEVLNENGLLSGCLLCKNQEKSE
jgi:hypothetical protein